jgi:type I restriction enzyme S subunit
MTIIPEGWVVASLDEVGEWRGGGTPSKSNAAYWTNGTVPWVSPKDMKRDRIDSASDMITLQAIDSSAARLIPEGSLLFVTRSGILKHSLPISSNTVPVAINQDLKALTPAPGIDPDFLRYQLKAQSDRLLGRASKSGTTVESIDFSDLKRFPVLLPPSGEQTRLVERIDYLLGRTGNARIALESIPAMLEAYHHAILGLAFSGRLTQFWRAAHSGRPEWQATTLGETVDIQSGVTLGSRRQSGVPMVVRPYLRVANVQRGFLDLQEVKRVAVTEAEAARLELKPGDILMNEGGDRDKLGRGWVWEGQIPGCIHQNHVFRLRLRDRAFPPKYISLFANEFGREYFFAQGTQTTNLASISKARLATLPIYLPTAEEAIEVLAAIDARLHWIGPLQQRLITAADALDALDRSILLRAFQGKLVAADSRDEPATNLLKRAREPRAKTAVNQKGTRKKGISIMERLVQQLERWPAEGMTFEALRSLLPDDYDMLKDCVFKLLTGANPSLKQRFDETDRVMRLFKVTI